KKRFMEDSPKGLAGRDRETQQALDQEVGLGRRGESTRGERSDDAGLRRDEGRRASRARWPPGQAGRVLRGGAAPRGGRSTVFGGPRKAADSGRLRRPVPEAGCA